MRVVLAYQRMPKPRRAEAFTLRYCIALQWLPGEYEEINPRWTATHAVTLDLFGCVGSVEPEGILWRSVNGVPVTPPYAGRVVLSIATAPNAALGIIRSRTFTDPRDMEAFIEFLRGYAEALATAHSTWVKEHPDFPGDAEPTQTHTQVDPQTGEITTGAQQTERKVERHIRRQNATVEPDDSGYPSGSILEEDVEEAPIVQRLQQSVEGAERRPSLLNGMRPRPPYDAPIVPGALEQFRDYLHNIGLKHGYQFQGRLVSSREVRHVGGLDFHAIRREYVLHHATSGVSRSGSGRAEVLFPPYDSNMRRASEDVVARVAIEAVRDALFGEVDFGALVVAFDRPIRPAWTFEEMTPLIFNSLVSGHSEGAVASAQLLDAPPQTTLPPLTYCIGRDRSSPVWGAGEIPEEDTPF